MQIIYWIKENLFGSKKDIILTLLGAYFIYFIASIFFEFVFTSDWTLIEVNRKILLVGIFPEDQMWRIWTVFSIFSILVSATLAYSYKLNIRISIFYVAFLAIPFLIFTTINLLPYVLAILLSSAIAYTLIYYMKHRLDRKNLSRILIVSSLST